MKRILLLHTGGTLGMVPMSADKTLKPAALAGEVFKYIPEACQLADVDVRMIYNIDSSNVQIEHWQLLADTIEREIDNYDGFVIIHGTDTMVYTASALSFMLMNLHKPVILTGSQRPIAEIRTDAKSNLIDSIEMATYDIPEVAISFNNQLFRGNRAKKISIDEFDAFATPNYPHLADVGIKLQIHHERLRRPTGMFKVQREFSDRVMIIRLFPGLSPEHLIPLLDTDIEAFIIEGFGAGNVPIQERSFIPFIEEATARDKEGNVLNPPAMQGEVGNGKWEKTRSSQMQGHLKSKSVQSAAFAKLEAKLKQLRLPSGKLKEPLAAARLVAELIRSEQERLGLLDESFMSGMNPADVNHTSALFCNETGESYLEGQSYASAASEFLTSITLDPTVSAPYYHLGTLVEKAGDKQSATAFYKRYLQVAPVGRYSSNANERLKTLSRDSATGRRVLK